MGRSKALREQLAHLNALAALVPLMFLGARQQLPNASCRILPLVTSIAPSHASSEDVRQVRSANMLASQASACTPIPMRSPARHLTLSSQFKNRLPSEQAIVAFCGCRPGHATASTLAAPQRLARNWLWGCFRTVFSRGTFASASSCSYCRVRTPSDCFFFTFA